MTKWEFIDALTDQLHNQVPSTSVWFEGKRNTLVIEAYGKQIVFDLSGFDVAKVDPLAAVIDTVEAILQWLPPASPILDLDLPARLVVEGQWDSYI